MTSYEQIFYYVEEISKQIESQFPSTDFSLLKVWVVFKSPESTSDHDGLCHVGYKKTKMKIEILVPNMSVVSAAAKRKLALILMHEYCHYVDALQQSAEERHIETAMYAEDPKHAGIDEHRTWKQTKSLTISLNLWSKRMYNIFKRYKHTAGIDFNG